MAWSWLLASATGLRGPIPTTRTRRVCIARAGPAIALFGKSRGDDDLVLRELDALKPTLSYQGWQRDVAEVESDYARYSVSIAARTLAKVRKKQQLHDGDRGHPLLRELDALKPTLSYQGWQRDVAEVESDYARYSVSIAASTLAMVRKKQQLHERVHKVTSPPSPPIAINNAEVPPLPLPGATSTDMPTASCARISLSLIHI